MYFITTIQRDSNDFTLDSSALLCPIVPSSVEISLSFQDIASDNQFLNFTGSFTNSTKL